MVPIGRRNSYAVITHGHHGIFRPLEVGPQRIECVIQLKLKMHFRRTSGPGDPIFLRRACAAPSVSRRVFMKVDHDDAVLSASLRFSFCNIWPAPCVVTNRQNLLPQMIWRFTFIQIEVLFDAPWYVLVFYSARA